jgi:hypothetical protein
MELTKGQIRKIALQLLNFRNCEVWPQNNVRAVKGRSFIGRKGVPDIIGFHRKTGVAVYVDVKTVNDKLSSDQIELMTAATNAGCIVAVATESKSGNVVLVDFKDYLKI